MTASLTTDSLRSHCARTSVSADTAVALPAPTRSPLGRAALRDDTGAATAEYAIATMAAVGFASLLVVIMRSDEVRGILTDLVRAALTLGV